MDASDEPPMTHLSFKENAFVLGTDVLENNFKSVCYEPPVIRVENFVGFFSWHVEKKDM
jgi:hypothetical protein